MTTRFYPPNPDDVLSAARFHVSLDTTSHCNLRCTHCWMDAVRNQGYVFKNEIMPFELYEKITGDLVGHTSSFGASCAFEPLLNKEFDRYVAHAVRVGLPDVHFYTNGTLMTPDMAARLVATGLQRIVFSLEGTDSSSFQEIRRGASFEKFLAAIDMVNRARAEQRRDGSLVIRLNWVVMPRNIARMHDLVELASAHGCNEILLMPHIRWIGTALDEPSLVAHDVEKSLETIHSFKAECAARNIVVVDDLFRLTVHDEPAAPPPPGGLGSLKERIRRLLRGGPAPVADPLGTMPFCNQPWEMMNITTHGTVFFCTGALLDQVYGDFRKQSLAEMWSSDECLSLRDGLRGVRPPREHCVKCSHFGLNRREVLFHQPREFDVELLRRMVPSITPKTSVPAGVAAE